MSSYSRRVFTPNASRKRKEPSDFDSLNSKAESSVKSNRLLAGYLAHEFLTQGTLFGQKWDPDHKRRVETTPPIQAEQKQPMIKRACYDDVTNLLKSEETQIPGVINPSQLVRWLEM